MCFRRTAEFLWRFRRALLGVALLLTVLAGSQLVSLGVSNSLEVWYPPDDPVLAAYRDFEDRFGNDEIVVVAVTGDGRFDNEPGAARIAELTDRLYAVDGVATVTSLSTVPPALAVARDRLVSRDGMTAALLVRMADRDDVERRRHAILEDIRRTAHAEALDARLAGYGVIYDTLNEASTEGAANLLLAAHLLMFVLLAFVFRRIGPVLVTLGCVAAATVWTMGLYAAFGQAINMLTMALPTLVLVIAVADCVHVLRAVARQPAGAQRKERAIRGMAAVFGPCLMTTLTTAGGFLALLASDLPIVRTLGTFGAIGMFAAFVAAFTILPALLASPHAQPAGRAGWPDATAMRLGALGERRPFSVVAAFLLLGLLAGVGLRSLDTDTFSIGYLSARHQTRLDSDFVESTIGSYAPLDYVVHAEDVLAPAVLDRLQAWQRASGALAQVDWSWSILDALGIERDAAASSLTPGDIRGRLARLRLLAPDLADSMVAGQTDLRVSFGAPMMSARRVQAVLDAIDANADFGPGVSVRAAGYAALYTRIVERIVDAQVRGFALAVLLIVGTIGIATRSIGRCLLALIANVLPVTATLGLMGWLDIPLDVATATIATVILGLIVDDTVHILGRRVNPGASLAATTRSALRGSGGSLVITSLVLAGGFLVLGLADIRSVAWFGLLTGFAMLAALATDLVMLPAIATLARRISKPSAFPQRFLRQASRLRQAFAARRDDAAPSAPPDQRERSMAAEIANKAPFDRLRYAQCWEDADVLLEALDVSKTGTYLSIASAGDNALALVGAGARRVIAVDLSAAQIACLELRVAAYRHLDYPELLELLGQSPSRRRQALYRRCRAGLSSGARDFWDRRGRLVDRGFAASGKFERYLALFRRFILPLAHRRATVQRLFTLESAAERRRFYEQHWDSRRWDWVCRLFFSRLSLGRLGRDPSFTRFADEPVWRSLRRRIPNALVVQRPAENPYLQWILAGRYETALPFALRAENFGRIRANLGALEWSVGSIDQVLATLPDRCVDGFNLSDIFEYVAMPAYEALLRELARVGAPGCRLVYWNVVVDRRRPGHLSDVIVPRRALAARLHRQDKAFFYRRLVIEEVCRP